MKKKLTQLLNLLEPNYLLNYQEEIKQECIKKGAHKPFENSSNFQGIIADVRQGIQPPDNVTTLCKNCYQLYKRDYTPKEQAILNKEIESALKQYSHFIS